MPDEHKDTFGYGDAWTWTAICADTKLVPSWLVGQRTTEDGLAFMYDLRERMAERIQLSTDGHQAYRGTNEFSKKIENHIAAVSIHFMHSNLLIACGNKQAQPKKAEKARTDREYCAVQQESSAAPAGQADARDGARLPPQARKPLNPARSLPIT